MAGEPNKLRLTLISGTLCLNLDRITDVSLALPLASYIELLLVLVA